MKKDHSDYRIIDTFIDEHQLNCNEDEICKLLNKLESIRISRFIGDSFNEEEPTKPRRTDKVETEAASETAVEEVVQDVPVKHEPAKAADAKPAKAADAKPVRKPKAEPKPEPLYRPGDFVEVQMYGMWWSGKVLKMKGTLKVIVKCTDGENTIVTLDEIRHNRKTRKAS